ncbi:hypothetical protein RB195_008350 [Necator americanus]|uniref:Uncharacterized protein n=1 Tax=Necator americanus TaxID=51031 RepID=A0ABR1CPQ9_NECAM
MVPVVDPSRHGDKRKRQAKKRPAVAKQTSLQLYGLFEPPYREYENIWNRSNASVMPQPREAEEENDQNVTMRIER